MRLGRVFHARSTPTYLAVGHDGQSVYYQQSGALSVSAFLHNMSILNFSTQAYRLATLKAQPQSPLTSQTQSQSQSQSQPQDVDHLSGITPEDLWTLAMGHLVHGERVAGAAMLERLVRDDPANRSGRADDALILLGHIDQVTGVRSGPPPGVSGAGAAPNAVQGAVPGTVPGAVAGVAEIPGMARWLEVMRAYPSSDRAADAVWYLAKAMRAAGRNDIVARLAPLLKGFPDTVDVPVCLKAVEGK